MATTSPIRVSQAHSHSWAADVYRIAWNIATVYGTVAKCEFDWPGDESLGSRDLGNGQPWVPPSIEFAEKCQVLTMFNSSRPTPTVKARLSTMSSTALCDLNKSGF